jgi:hypothetical protein
MGSGIFAGVKCYCFAALCGRILQKSDYSTNFSFGKTAIIYRHPHYGNSISA